MVVGLATVRYVKALFALAKSRGEQDVLGQEVARLGTLFQTSPELVQLVRNPKVAVDAKKRVLRSALLDQTSATLRDFVEYCLDHRRFDVVLETAEEFARIDREDRGIVVANVDSAQALVTLAELPIVSLRHGLPEALLTGQASYNETVEAARRALAPVELRLQLAKRTIVAAGKTIRLAPAELALLSVFARRLRHGEPPLPAPTKDAPDVDWKQRYLIELRWIGGPMKDFDQTERALRSGMDGSYFSAHLSKLRKSLRRALGPAAEPYLISDGGSRPRRYRLELPRSAVHYECPEAAICP